MSHSEFIHDELQRVTKEKEVLEHELKQFQWIGVDERLPEAREEIIAQTKRHGVKMGRSMGYKTPTIWTSHSEHQFTHWMPLPKPPANKL